MCTTYAEIDCGIGVIRSVGCWMGIGYAQWNGGFACNFVSFHTLVCFYSGRKLANGRNWSRIVN